MKQLLLQKLVLTNFKGIKHFELNLNGKNGEIFGENEAGKTTLNDGFHWALFGKDSQNKKDFGIKTKDQEGNELHALDHSVEVTFLVDGKQLTLKKVYKEVYTKKRGQVTSEFTGHTTDHYLDGVPASMKEYNDKVAELIDEKIFKLLTNPAYFNDVLKPKERRNMLLDIAGDISDDEVIASDKKLAKLLKILDGRSIEDHKKVIAAKQKDINKELDRIPVRIDEAHRSLPDTSGLNKEELASELAFLEKEKAAKSEEYNSIQNGTEIGNKQRALVELQTKQIDLENAHRAKEQDGVLQLRRELNKHQENLDNFEYKQRRVKRDIEGMQSDITKKEQIMAQLRNEWTEVNKKVFNFEEDTHCSLCGQALPEEKLASQKEDAQNRFNKEKSEKLEAIQAQGKQLAAESEDLKTKVKALSEEIQGYDEAKSLEQESIESLKTQILKAEESTTDVQDTPEYQEIQKQRQKLESDIQALRESSYAAVSKVREEEQKLAGEIKALESDLAKFESVNHINKRIAELQAEQQELAAAYEELEGQEYLANEFIKAKVNLLESKINSKFKYARFKLFEPQINGGLQEVCKTMYKGVPYGEGLNNAGCINVGLDIINTLFQHYGITVPIFIDNSEAVTQLIDVDSQVISLRVSKGDTELRVETKDLQEAI
ncbi:AAA family ATPase [Terribacillus saccharophilus]|uniref:AAA family ATPase n=1 Tax=Terribacillus saccharophilus TaxID=361277 RepID=UPI000BA716DE|nr:AAA family ATPase [Terribacillus saccharophilus]PAF15927.1 hypothetical protein CHH51_18140 [Terribacillus saccharophilus]